MDVKPHNRKELEARAEALGVKFAANIGDEKLKERLKEAEQKTQGGAPAQAGADVGEAGVQAGAAEAAPVEQTGAKGANQAGATRPEVPAELGPAHEGMVSAEVLRPLRRSGEKYQIGQQIELDQESFDYLKAKGVVA